MTNNMSNMKDKNLEAIDAAMVALTAISNSSELAKPYVDSDGNPVSLGDEIEVIHSIANETLKSLHDYLDDLV